MLVDFTLMLKALAPGDALAWPHPLGAIILSHVSR